MRKTLSMILPVLAIGCAASPSWDNVTVGRPLPPVKRGDYTLGSVRGVIRYDEPSFCKDHVLLGLFQAVVDDSDRVVVKSQEYLRCDGNVAYFFGDPNESRARKLRGFAQESNCFYTRLVEFEIPAEAFREPPAAWVIPDRWLAGALYDAFLYAQASDIPHDGNEPFHVLGRVKTPQGGHVWKLSFEQFKNAIRESARDMTFRELFFWGKDGGKDSNFCYQLERLEHHLEDNVAGCFIFSLLMATGMKSDTPTGYLTPPMNAAREELLGELFMIELILIIGNDDTLARAIIEKGAFRGATRSDVDWKYRDDSMSLRVRAVGERRLRVEMSTWGPGSELVTAR